MQKFIFSIFPFLFVHFNYEKIRIYLPYLIIIYEKRRITSMRKNAKRLAALAMSGVMTLSVAPVAVHADDKVELTGMVQQSRWYSGLQNMVQKLEEDMPAHLCHHSLQAD